MLITMTNVCFAAAIHLSQVMVMVIDGLVVHAYLMVEIISVFKRIGGHRQDYTRSKCHLELKGA